MESVVSRNEFVRDVLDAYSDWYDVEEKTSINIPLAATAVFHEHQTGFALIRKAEMWSADRHEYVYIYSIPTLDSETFEKCIKDTIVRGEEAVNPEFGHMCTNIVSVFITNNATSEAIKALKKYRYRKSFLFSLKGWLETQTTLVSLDSMSVVNNMPGRQTGEFMKKMLKRCCAERHAKLS